MTENQSDRTLNYGRFGLVIGKLKLNRPTVFYRPLPGVTQAHSQLSQDLLVQNAYGL